MNRKSLLVKIGRRYQKIAPYLSWFDYVLYPLYNSKKEEPQYIFLLAPPRSGSTVTYQLLCNSVRNFHLTNIGNLTYSTPLLGGWLSHKLCKDKASSFRSEHGFVSGMCGEAEGLAFWKYWTGVSLSQRGLKVNQKMAQTIISRMARLNSRYKFGTCIAGYLGHVFSIEEFRKSFKNALFIHLVRDPVSNAASIYKIQPELNAKPFSTIPVECEKHYSDRSEQIVDQIFHIHKKILSCSQSEDTIHIRYEDICTSPNRMIDKITTEAGIRGFILDKMRGAPDSFPFQVKDATYENYVEFNSLFEKKGMNSLLSSIQFL